MYRRTGKKKSLKAYLKEIIKTETIKKICEGKKRKFNAWGNSFKICI